MYEMNYGKTVFPVELPQRTTRERIEYALDHPIGQGGLGEAVKPGDKVCIVISDVTRSWQSQSWLQISLRSSCL